ncbi:hypothetical protein FQA39_LY01978 [Lamprigera yunnana]|nr:hypothetical protein FQA39_LY01978 [Lamprigera yunnana]
MLCYVLIFILIIIVANVLFKLSIRWDRSYTCLLGKTALVTGANSGIGFYTAKDFAKRGAKVILACRDRGRAEEARRKIIEDTDNANVHVRLVDFSSLRSVREFAKRINKEEERLDILVNNAGTLLFTNETTEDGLNSLMQINHFGPFLLTLLLINLLKKSTPSRIVNVSSNTAYIGKVNIQNLNYFSENLKARLIFTNYGNTKLCNILFTNELARRLSGSGVTTNSLHPGMVMTNIGHDVSNIVKVFYWWTYIFLITSEAGAQTSIYVAVSKECENITGQFFINCKIGIGFYTAKDFAKRGAKVILACRDRGRAEEARRKIIEDTDNANVHVRLVDFSSLRSVREFAKRINKEEERLDILVNNAGTLLFTNETTEDGLNSLMQINHFGPFLLTLLLINLLKKSTPSRIVNVSSDAAYFGKVNIQNLNYFSENLKARLIFTNYGNTKLCNILFTNELARRLSGGGVTTNSLHPGMVMTNLGRDVSNIVKVLYLWTYFFIRTSEAGAQTSIYVAVSKDCENITGQYFLNCKIGKAPAAAKDAKLALKLWEESEKYVKLTKEEKIL